MKIAVPYQDGKVFPHFGHSEFFKLYQIEDEKIKNSVVLHSDEDVYKRQLKSSVTPGF